MERKDSEPKPNSVIPNTPMFAFVIWADPHDGQVRFQAQGEGIHDYIVVQMVEMWLKKVKEDVEKNFRDSYMGINSSGQQPDDDEETQP